MGDPSECTIKQTQTERGAKRPGSKATVYKKHNTNGNVYGLTVRHNPTYHKDGTKITDREKRDLYNQLIGQFKAKGLMIDNLYYESKGGLHFHARATYPKKLYFKKWQVKPFSCKFVKMYNPDGWNKYCQKEQTHKQIDKYIKKQYQRIEFSSSE